MKSIYNIEDFSPNKPVALTLGMFDGVHLGHQEVINRLVEEAKSINGVSVLLTFDTHPRKVVQPDSHISLLSLQEEKKNLLEKTDLDYVVFYPFTKELSQKSAFEFVRDVLVKELHISLFLMGYNNKFGRNRELETEEMEHMQEIFGFQWIVLDEWRDSVDEKISSTVIRNEIVEGKIKEANHKLGYRYSFYGKVVDGEKIGNELGFPTANLQVHPDKLIPGNGVYAVWIESKKVTGKAMMNIGTRPTLNKNHHQIEVHVLDWEGDLYEEEVKVVLYEKLRNEIKFDTIHDLKNQLHQDKLKTVEVFTDTHL